MTPAWRPPPLPHRPLLQGPPSLRTPGEEGHPLPPLLPARSAWRAAPNSTTARCSVSLLPRVPHRYFRRPSTPARGPPHKDTVVPCQARSLGAPTSLVTCPLEVSLAIACHQICSWTPPFIAVGRLMEHVSGDKAASSGACGTRPTALSARSRWTLGAAHVRSPLLTCRRRWPLRKKRDDMKGAAGGELDNKQNQRTRHTAGSAPRPPPLSFRFLPEI